MMIFSVEVQIIQQSPLYFPNDIRVGISPSKKKKLFASMKVL